MTPCSVCGHRDREQIDRALESGQSARQVAEKYGIPKSNVHRHAKKHLAAAVQWRKEHPVAALVLAAQDELLAVLYRTLHDAEERGLKATAVRTVREINRSLTIRLQAERVQRNARGHGKGKDHGFFIVHVKDGEAPPDFPEEDEGIMVVVTDFDPAEAEKAEREQQEYIARERRNALQVVRSTKPPVSQVEAPVTADEIMRKAMVQSLLDEADEEDGL